uniref:Uncharacterized protein n=1 Tax=Glossina austeni TaxID=7395 RepID=A0A1A9V8Q5_GLOAU
MLSTYAAAYGIHFSLILASTSSAAFSITVSLGWSSSYRILYINPLTSLSARVVKEKQADNGKEREKNLYANFPTGNGQNTPPIKDRIQPQLRECHTFCISCM